MKYTFILLILILVDPFITTAFAQEFQTYTSEQYGFQIQYSDSWKVIELKDAVRFSPSHPIDKNSDHNPNVTIEIKPAESFLDTTDMKIKLKPPQTYGENIVSFMGEKPVRSSPINVTGADLAWKVEYTHNAPAYNGKRYFIQVDTIKNNTRYMIEMSAPSLEMPENLPIFQKMIDSFKLT